MKSKILDLLAILISVTFLLFLFGAIFVAPIVEYGWVGTIFPVGLIAVLWGTNRVKSNESFKKGLKGK